MTTIHRRTVLSFPLGVAAAAAAHWVGRLPPPPPHAALEFEAFAARWADHAAATLGGADADDDVYAWGLLALLARLDLATLPDYRKRNESPGVVAGPIFGMAVGELSIAAIRFELEAGRRIQPHDHPPQVVASVGVAGEATFRHFESEGSKPPHEVREPFTVHEMVRGRLRPGRVTALTRAKNWIHAFEAGPQGATLVDFTCSLPGDPGDWSYLELIESRGEATWSARWVGK